MAKLTAARPRRPAGGVPCPVPGCACRPPSLVVHTEADDVAVEPSATPAGPACRYQAYRTGCGATYPGPFRARHAARPRQLLPS